MTIRASKFTPQAMLSAPRRQAGVPNSDGSQVLYQISNYSFETQEESGAIKLLDVETKETKTVTDDKEVSNPTWVTDNFVAFLRGRDDGQTDLLFGSIKDALEQYVFLKNDPRFAASVNHGFLEAIYPTLAACPLGVLLVTSRSSISVRDILQ